MESGTEETGTGGVCRTGGVGETRGGEQIRPLSAYPVGSRWLDSRGGIIVIESTDNGLHYPLEGYWEGLTLTRGTWSLKAAATWTRIDAAAPDALREALKGFVSLLADDERRYVQEMIEDAKTALAQPAPEPAVKLPPLPSEPIQFVAPQLSPTPPTFDERRWQAALAALPWALASARPEETREESVTLAVAVADALLAAMEASDGR